MLYLVNKWSILEWNQFFQSIISRGNDCGFKEALPKILFLVFRDKLPDCTCRWFRGKSLPKTFVMTCSKFNRTKNFENLRRVNNTFTNIYEFDHAFHKCKT